MPLGSTIRDFAEVLSHRVDVTRPHALIGVSLGGLVAQDLAALTRAERVIIVSSWKGMEEMPAAVKLLHGTHAERILTPGFMKHGMPIVRWHMGLETKADNDLFDAFLAATPLEQVRVQIAAVLGWEGSAEPVAGLVHIHGDHDRLMPITHIDAATVIKGGGHFMVFNRAAEVASAILAALPSTRSKATPP